MSDLMTVEELARRMADGWQVPGLLPYARLLLDLREALRLHADDDMWTHEDAAALARADELLGRRQWYDCARQGEE